MVDLDSVLVKEIMSPKPVHAVVPSTRQDVLEIIRTEKYLGLPVVKKEDGTLVGIVTAEDLLRKQSETQTALLMTRDPVTVKPDDSLRLLLEKIFSHGHRRYPVVDEENKLIGIVTITDIRNKILAKYQFNDKIENFLPDYVVLTWEEMPIPVAAEQMRLGKVKMMPVVNTELKVTGILTYYDFLKVIEVVDKEEAVEMQTFGEGEPGSWDSNVILMIASKEITLPTLPVKTTMQTSPITAYKGNTVTEVAKKMRRYDIDALPVVDSDGVLVSIIKDIDLVQALKNH